MSHSFFRYPHIPHLAWLAGGSPREDKVLSPSEVALLLAGPVVVEEKLDGANLGFSIDSEMNLRVQNRGSFLHSPYPGQFSKLGQWIAWHGEKLRDALDDKLIFFGEWCAARHSVSYSELPDWWLLFDVYDKHAGKFWSVQRRDSLAKALQIEVVPKLFEGMTSLVELQALLDLHRSRFGASKSEGLIVRNDCAEWLVRRAKLVRGDFVQAIESHWRSRAVEWNRLKY